ncbi:MAG: hypothetical protein ABFD77_05450 [Thermotogota bacterium]
MPAWTDEQRHERMGVAHAQATRLCPDRIHETWYTFGGRVVRMRIVGHQLAERLALPFAHLRRRKAVPSDARLTIDLWDELETGVPADTDLRPVVEGSSFSASRDGRFATSVLQHSISSLDRQGESIVGVALDADRLSVYECGRPLHVPLSLWYNDRGVPLIHAALVSHQGDGVLLAGPSGAGKTTSALSCLFAGFHYLADDLAGLEIPADGAAWGHSVYGSALVDQGTLLHLPTLRPHAILGNHGRGDKRLVFISQVSPTELAGKTRIRAIGLVRVANAACSHVRPAAKGESLMTMIRSTLQGGALSPGRQGFELLGRLCGDVPSFWLELGRGVEDVPRCILELLVGRGEFPGGRVP